MAALSYPIDSTDLKMNKKPQPLPSHCLVCQLFSQFKYNTLNK